MHHKHSFSIQLHQNLMKGLISQSTLMGRNHRKLVGQSKATKVDMATQRATCLCSRGTTISYCGMSQLPEIQFNKLYFYMS